MKESMSKIVETHKPKYFKYKYIIKSDDVYKELEEENYDIDSLDTIKDEELCNIALKCNFAIFDRSIIKTAKVPSILEEGVIISKHMITKADKKLLEVGLGFFELREIHYVCIKFVYEKFDIIEIFVKI